jgi:hypothetical protein
LFSKKPELKYPPVFGDGKAAEFICGKLMLAFEKQKN